jgi:diguanylate cyclase (GGDEF)-like protein
MLGSRLAGERQVFRQARNRVANWGCSGVFAGAPRTEGVTGIANRRKFDQALAVDWKRGFRDRTPLAVIMIDADHFKDYNDLYGHASGDDCLRRIAAILYGSSRRPADLAARYGGEEFVMILPSTSISDAVAIGEKICHAIAGANIPHDGNEGGIVTASVGVAALIPAPEATPQQLVEAADQALYKAKKRGRNRVVQYHWTVNVAATMAENATPEVLACP